MVATRVRMPQLGESVREGTVAQWLVKLGDRVVELEPMLVVDTDKVNAEVPAPVTGTLKEILAQEGETVSVGAEIAVIEVEAGTDVSNERPSSSEGVPRKAADTGLIASKPDAVTGQPDDSRQLSAANPEPRDAITDASKQVTNDWRHSPAVRRFADNVHLDISQLVGTGVGGRVTRRDVLFAVDAREHSGAGGLREATSSLAQVPPAAAIPPQELSGDEVVPLSRIRRLIADNLTRSKNTVPHAWQTQEVDMAGVVANRNANKDKFQQQEGFSLTYLPYVVAAATASLRENRHVNSTFNGDHILVHHEINIGISVGLEDTLLVPVIRHADEISMADIARAINDLSTRARTKKLRADDLAGATFTVNNSGTFGTTFSYSIINPGQAGILTMEAIIERPVAVSGLIGIKPMMYLCFSLDHRVLDGLQAARFLRACRQWLEGVTDATPIY